MSIVFIAVQCYQCSTMQVKQQKKSSSKWTCVICNEKQSVRKIHAQGYKAKDVRGFVQGFNSSRSAGGRSDGSGWISPRSEEGYDGGCEGGDGGGHRRRMDWSEYLDQEAAGEREEEEEEEEERGEFVGPMVTTELSPPSKKFGRSFRKRPLKIHQSKATVEESRNLTTNFPKKRQNEASQGNSGSVKCQRAGMERAASKWSKYLDEEEEGIGLKFRGDENDFENVKESMLSGFVVKDEVHPDFI